MTPNRKFYKHAEAAVLPAEGTVQYGVRLDGKVLKTPLRHVLSVSSSQLAHAVAAEWNAQGENILPDTMPLTQLANTMIDKVMGGDRAALTSEVMNYAGSDLVCYLALSPPDLVARQERLWLSLVDWLEQTYSGARLSIVRGIQFQEQTEKTVQAIHCALDALSPAKFAAAQAVVGAVGSVVIALALVTGRLTSAQAQEAACVDELYQLEKWGEDKLARDRINRIGQELSSCAEFVRLSDS